MTEQGANPSVINNEYPPEEFYEYFKEGYKLSEMIHLIWGMMTNEQRQEILDLYAESHKDDEQEPDVDEEESTQTSK
jgi:hypothetical protein